MSEPWPLLSPLNLCDSIELSLCETALFVLRDGSIHL